MLKRLQAFAVRIYRQLLKINWVDKITIEEDLRLIKRSTEITNSVKCRKLKLFGNVMGHPEKYNILQLILQGEILGKRGPRRRRTSWLKNLRKWFGKLTISLFW